MLVDKIHYMKNLNLLGIAGLLLFFSACRKTPPTQAVKQLSWTHANSEQLAAQEVPLAKSAKKRVLIFSSTGGGGHTAAAQAIKEYLGPQRYDVEVVNVFSDIIQSIDLIHYYTGVHSGEKIYDYLLQNQFILLAEMYASLGRTSLRFSTTSIEELLEAFLRKNRPNVIVSIIPMVNGSVYRVARKLGIPFVVIPVDLDITNYCNGLDASDPKNFLFCLNFKHPSIEAKLSKIAIPEEHVRYVGFPVRPEFLHATKSVPALKREFKMPQDKKIVMVLMGSAGSRATYRYARALAKVEEPLHLILCLGRNVALRAAIESIPFPPHISVTIMGFTNRIADLMRLSDVLITKSGPTSICEALCVGVPMIIDRTQKVLWWEKMNIDFVTEHGFGDELCMMRKLPRLLKRYIQDDAYTNTLRKRMHDFSYPRVEHNVRAVIDETIALRDTDHPDSVDEEFLK
jgi:UDP-N-acetylglucosamine:LPS N-acetylglucosamine transferase